MRFASLGSGSRGNATLIEAGDTCLLVDCGFSVAETRRRLERLGSGLDRLSAILVTHEHGDHLRGVAPLARRLGIPLWMTDGTAAVARDTEVPVLRRFNSHRPFTIGDIRIEPFPVPHDAREPCQFVFGDGACRLGLLTDTGSATDHIVRSLAGCDALILECNHDERMLAEGPYPPLLKQRVSGRYGHLSNAQAADLLGRLDAGRLQHLIAAHLSEKNNRPALAVEALAGTLDCEAGWIQVADQDQGFGWRDLV
ncbi:MBL fold metallo-hydrolase [Thiohalobacter sp. IOR34]|uniref:MBL fold metallo-hydrolase n=1 Tax=Thiohalobacter sp. IOR34 TaxID=3057176 RepID=UPI0025B21A7C|nr:MBL fold metallo-hydrolase [Thiohalobacter sp. IOR34]WJW76206.1 MBL fold metallo-hydrolase [Thiohalobacter sp. IOR34]